MVRPQSPSDDDSDDMAVIMTHKGKENSAPSKASTTQQRTKLAQLDRTADESGLLQDGGDEEEAPPPSRKPSASNSSSSKPRPTPSASSSKPLPSLSIAKPTKQPASSRKAAPPPPRPVLEEEEDSLMDGQDDEDEEEEEVVVPPKKGGSSSRKGAANGGGKAAAKEDGVDVKVLLGRIKKLERSVYEITAERDAFEKERDTHIRHFDELSKIRNTQAEENFKSYREKAEARADKLNDLNKTLTAAYEKEKKERVRLAALGPQAPVAAVVPVPVKGTKDLERIVKEQAKKAKEQAEQIDQLQRELKTEVANSRQLLKASSSTASAAAAAPASSSAEEITKDQRVAVFYEDLTNLAVVGVKFLKSEHGALEPEFNCVYTYDPTDGKSLNFKIRQTAALNSDLVAAGHPNPYHQVLVYTPLRLEAESEEFKESLSFLADGFSTKWDKANVLWKEISTRVGAEPEEEEEEDDEGTEQQQQ